MESPLEQGFALHLPKGDKSWSEGWYVHVQTKEISFAIIFGLQISNAKKSASTQFLDTHTKKSRYAEYPWEIATIQQHSFVLNIRGNRLSVNSVTLRLSQLQVDLLYSSLTPLHTSPYASTTMSPFSYVPTEYVHSIISLCHTVSGTIRLNNRCLQIHGSGYTGRNRSTSSPSTYVWLQSNNREDTVSRFFFSLAHIPLLTGSLQGCICVLVAHEEQLCFVTCLRCRVAEGRKNQQVVLK